MPEMKTLNGYEVVDAKAREDIEGLQNAGHATEEYVDNAIAAIPEVDLSKHALKSEIPIKVSQLQNDSKYITREEVPETDLSEYAKKSELPTVPKKVSELTNDTGYITAAEVPKTDLSDYAKKSDIPDVSDFITNIPGEYITESELEAKGYLTQHQDISGKADKVHTHPEYLTEHQSLDGYATEKYVDEAIADIEITGGGGNSGDCKAVVLDMTNLTSSVRKQVTTEQSALLDSLVAGNKYCIYVVPASGDSAAARAVTLYNVVTSDSSTQVYMYLGEQIIPDNSSPRYGYNFNKVDGVWQGCLVKSTYTFASKTYVDEAIAALEARIVALEGGNT